MKYKDMTPERKQAMLAYNLAWRNANRERYNATSLIAERKRNAKKKKVKVKPVTISLHERIDNLRFPENVNDTAQTD